MAFGNIKNLYRKIVPFAYDNLHVCCNSISENDNQPVVIRFGLGVSD